jgi:hypothetical protein
LTTRYSTGRQLAPPGSPTAPPSGDNVAFELNHEGNDFW